MNSLRWISLKETERKDEGKIRTHNLIITRRVLLRCATTVAKTTVPSISSNTAPVDWRAISPVSMVTVCWPHWKV